MPATQFDFIKCNRASITEKMGSMEWTGFAHEIDKIKAGDKAYIEIHRRGNPKSPEELGYYYGVILPMAFEALKDNGEITVTISAKDKSYCLPLDKNTTDVLLKWRYGKWHGAFKDKGDMNMAECAAFMDWCIIWLATHYECHVPPADPNWDSTKKEGE